MISLLEGDKQKIRRIMLIYLFWGGGGGVDVQFFLQIDSYSVNSKTLSNCVNPLYFWIFSGVLAATAQAT